ncbi:MAG: hypothetical protein RL662_1184, partial [Bacteroidota bacterium]
QYLFMPEQGEITIQVGDQFLLSGTPKNEELQTFLTVQDSLQTQMSVIVNKYSCQVENSAAIQIKRAQELKAIEDQFKKLTYDFAKSNITNYLGEFVTLSSGVLSADQILELVSLTTPEFRNSDLGKQVLNYYEAQNLKNGGVAYKDIKLKNTAGQDVALSDYVGKNKLVLVDFWASWCGPCIKDMPNLVAAYEKYKKKGLEIVGVSLDEKQQNWSNTITRLGMIWPQMSDLKGWKSESAQLYGIDSIPFTLLIDEKGMIVASDLRGYDLINKLSELLD